MSRHPVPAAGQAELRRLDLTLLLVFDGLVRERKLTAVARRMGLTQSSVSHALARLRDIFGDELFLRRPDGVAPTPRALEIAPRVVAILEEARLALGADRFEPALAQGRVTIGAPDSACALVAGPLLQRLRGATPGLDVVFRPLLRREALQALGRGELDLALGFFWGVPAEYGREPLFEDGYVVAGRRGHPALRRLTLERFLAVEHAIVSISGDTEGVVDKALAALGHRRRVVAALPYFLPLLATLAQTNLLATVPSRLARSHARAFGLQLTKPPLDLRRFTVSAVWHQRQGNAALRHWLVAELRAALRLPPPGAEQAA